MRASVVLAAAVLFTACATGDSSSSAPASSDPPGSSSSTPSTVDCHPANDREDCRLAVVLLGEPIDLVAAEKVAADHNAYLNALFRVDPVCVTKDFPMMPGSDLGDTASRRVYWEAEARLARIAADVGGDLVPPPTMGGFDQVIDQRIRDEWRLAQQPGVMFDSRVLWLDEANAMRLADDFTVELPELGGDFGRYTHREGRGEIRVDRYYEPPALLPITDPGCVGVEL